MIQNSSHKDKICTHTKTRYACTQRQDMHAHKAKICTHTKTRYARTQRQDMHAHKDKICTHTKTRYARTQRQRERKGKVVMSVKYNLHEQTIHKRKSTYSTT